MNILKSIRKYTIYITVFLLPIFILPVFPNPFDTPKIVLLAASAAILVATFGLEAIMKSEVKINLSALDLGVLLFAASILLSVVFRTPNKMEAFFVPGTATLILMSSIIYFFVTQENLSKATIAKILFISGTVFSIFSLLAGVGIFKSLGFLPPIFKITNISLAGTLFSGALLLIPLLPLGFAFAASEKEITRRLFWTTGTLILVFGLAIIAYQIFTNLNREIAFLDFPTSWGVAMESVRENPLFGVGVGNYQTAFSRFRPLTFNSSRLWQSKFPSASDFYLNILTEAGILGFLSFSLIIYLFIKNTKPNRENLGVNLGISLALILLGLFPASLLLIFVLFLLLGVAQETKTQISISNKTAIVLSSLILILICLLFLFWGAKTTYAEYLFNKSLTAATKNKGKDTYDSVNNAIRLNPYVDRYHLTAAQVNLALAQGLAQNLPAQAGKNLSDNDRNTVSTLIQQALREAKAGVTLNPQRSTNWIILARTYQSVMAFAQGADTFTVQTYNQAILLDPIDPNLRIALGGVFYSLGRYDEAIDTFKLATLAKGDFANAHYNLAIVYREKGEIDKAIAEINTVLSLVDKNSKDYETAKAELDNLEKKRPSSAKKTEEQGNLTSPTKSQKLINPPLPLPEEATPSTTTP